MERLEYEIEFITPAFIGGADPGEYAELRPASLVGLFRYWFRVIAGAFVQESKNIFSLESELFGSQDKAGKVWVKVRGNVNSKLDVCKRWQAERDRGIDWGKVYMGFGNIFYIDFSKKRNRDRYKMLLEACKKREGKKIIDKGYFSIKPWLEHKQSAKLEIITPNYLKRKVEALLFITSQLGAVGSRSRRGWGSLYIVPTYNKSSFSNWNYWSKEELKYAFKALGFDVPKDIEFYLMDYKHQDPMVILEEVGRIFKKFREKFPPDYENVKNFIENGNEKEVEIKRAYFGLPLRFRFSKSNKEVEVNTNTGRFASPVRFKIIRLNKDYYTCLLIHMKNTSIPDKITIRSNGKKAAVIKPSDDIFIKFINKTGKFIREEFR